MHFNGLIRKFKNLQTLKDDADFIVFKTLMEERMSVNNESIPVNTYPFQGQRILRLAAAPPHLVENRNNVILKEKEILVLGNLLVKIESVFKEPHKSVLVQLISVNPMTTVTKHVDGKEYFVKTKRFNIILEKAGLKYYCFHGADNRSQIQIETGDIFELNNRSHHLAENDSQSHALIVVIDFIETSAEQLPDDVLTVNNIEGRGMTANSPQVIWDY